MAYTNYKRIKQGNSTDRGGRFPARPAILYVVVFSFNLVLICINPVNPVLFFCYLFLFSCVNVPVRQSFWRMKSCLPAVCLEGGFNLYSVVRENPFTNSWIKPLLTSPYGFIRDCCPESFTGEFVIQLSWGLLSVANFLVFLSFLFDILYLIFNLTIGGSNDPN